jgi:hypothetical protein
LFSVSNTGDVGNGAGSGLPPNSVNNVVGQGCFDPVSGVGDYICFSQGPVFGPSPSGSPPFNAFSVVQNFKTPRYHNYNLSIQQEVARNNVLTVGYSGQRGDNLVLYHDMNASPIGSGGDDTERPFFGQFPDLKHIIQATNSGYSKYDSLQVSYNQRAWHGLDTQYNLTWSKCFDTNSVNRGGAGDYPQINNDNPVGSTAPAHYSARDSYGLCDHDVRLNFNVGGVYAFPAIRALGTPSWRRLATEHHLHCHQRAAIYSAARRRWRSFGQGLTGSAIRAAWDGTPIHYQTRNPDQYVVETFTAPGQPDPCGNLSDRPVAWLCPRSSFLVTERWQLPP